MERTLEFVLLTSAMYIYYKTLHHRKRQHDAQNFSYLTWSWYSSPTSCSASCPSFACLGNLMCTLALTVVPKLVGQKVRKPSFWFLLNFSCLLISSTPRTRRPYTSPTFPPWMKIIEIAKVFLFHCLLIHSDAPQSRRVVIIVFAQVSVCTSVPTFQNIAKQTSLENNVRCLSGLWVWPMGSLMTHVLFFFK